MLSGEVRLEIAEILAGQPMEDVLDEVLELHWSCTPDTLGDRTVNEGNEQYFKDRLEIYAKLADLIIDVVATCSCGCIIPSGGKDDGTSTAD
jgi:hypothetical protein